MRKLLTITMILVCGMSYGQSDTAGYNRSQLETMGKMSLSKIYLNQLEQFIVIMPGMPMGSTSANVPDNRYTRNRWKAINRSNYWCIKKLKENCVDLLPYSDKSELVNSILFMQHVLKGYDQIKNN
jgi:hypothetical protein